MGRKRKTAAGLCVLMFMQALVPGETAWAGNTGKMLAAEESAETAEESGKAAQKSEKATEESAETTKEKRKSSGQETESASQKIAEKETAEAETAEPETTEPETTEPEITEPETTKPETTEPETAEPETTEQKMAEPETDEPETTQPETTEKGNARRQEKPEEETQEPESKEAKTETGAEKKDLEEKDTSLGIEVTADEERARVFCQLSVQAPEEASLQLTIPQMFAVEEISREDEDGRKTVLTEGEDWEVKDGEVLCRLEKQGGEMLYEISMGLNGEAMKTYMESGEALEAEFSGAVSLLDQKDKVLAEKDFPKETLSLRPFLEKEAQGQGRAQKTFVWTDWVNLGANPGKGYLAAVIEDLEGGHHFDFENGCVMLLDSQGEVKEEIPVTKVQPDRSGAFGEIFTAEDARELLGGISGAGFYSYEDDEEQQNGILIVPVEAQAELTGISYRTRVSAAEEPGIYQWSAALESGSKFLWEQAEPVPQEETKYEAGKDYEAERDYEAGQDAAGKNEDEASAEAGAEDMDVSKLLHPVWEIRAARISADKEPGEKAQTFAAKSIWLSKEASCSLVSQQPGEDGYSLETGTAVWDFLVNQNGEDVKEAVITRELRGSEQSFSGAISDGKEITAVLCRGDASWEDETEEAVILPYEGWEEMQESEEASSDFYGYYVLDQQEETERLEIHLFQLGQAACRFFVETKVKDGAFAAWSEEFSISSGDTAYTAVLENRDGQVQQTEGECGTEIPAENAWLLLEAAEGYDYADHSLELEMTVNPDGRSLTDPEVMVTLSDGLEQVEIRQVTAWEKDGRQEDITEEEWIRAEEEAPDERTGESHVLFSWREAKEDEKRPSENTTYRIRFRCRMSEDMRNESFLSGDEEVLFAGAQLTGNAGASGEEEAIAGAEAKVSIEWNSAAAAGEGYYLENRYSQENSRWDGTRMPRAEWRVVINRNEGDLTGARFVLEWPDSLQADPASLRIYMAQLDETGGLGSERQQIWPYEDAEDEEEARSLLPEDQVKAEADELEIILPDSLAGRTLCVELTTFVQADMEESDFAAVYRLERDADTLESGEFSVNGARAVSILEAAEKNRIPSAAVMLTSANSDSGQPYGLSGAVYRLTRMEAIDEDGQWDSFQEADAGKDESGAVMTAAAEDGGQAAFLFLEEDTLYKLEEIQPAEGYEPWEEARYLVLLDKLTESDFPQEDEEHKLYAGETQVLIREEKSLARWKSGEETVRGGRLEFYVEDQEGNPLENVSCSLTYAAYEKEKTGRLKSRQAASDKDGLVVFDGLDPLMEGKEGYEIHVTAPYGMEDPAEFSAGTAVEEDGSFRTWVEGKAARQEEDGIYVTCLPASADVRIPVTDQNGNLLAGCGLELQVERLEEPEEETETEKENSQEETAARFASYQPMPSAAEDGSGCITLTDLPYGTYRVFGGRSIMTLILDEDGVEGWLEPVEAESERGDRKTVRLELEPDEHGVYTAAEEDGWYMEEFLPRRPASFRLRESGLEDSAVSGSRFLVYETWSDRLVGELKESSQEAGLYQLTASERPEAVLINDRGLSYIEDGKILPGTYAVWEIQAAEGFSPDGSGVWYFQSGGEEGPIGNEALIDGGGQEKPFENSVIRCQVPFLLTPEMEEPEDNGQEKPEDGEPESAEQENAAEEKPAKAGSLTVTLRGTAWGSGNAAGDYEAELTCAAGESLREAFDQVPVGIYILRIDPDSMENLTASPGIQVQVQYDGQVIFRTIGGRLLEEGELTYGLR